MISFRVAIKSLLPFAFLWYPLSAALASEHATIAADAIYYNGKVITMDPVAGAHPSGKSKIVQAFAVKEADSSGSARTARPCGTRAGTRGWSTSGAARCFRDFRTGISTGSAAVPALTFRRRARWPTCSRGVAARGGHARRRADS